MSAASKTPGPRRAVALRFALKHFALRSKLRSWYAPLLAALLVLTLLPPAARALAQGGPVSISGVVDLPDGRPAVGATVWYAPLTALGAFDWSRASRTVVFSAVYNFSVPGPGAYGLQIDPPPNEPSARTLQDFTFNVPQGGGTFNVPRIVLPAATKRIAGTVALKSGAGTIGLEQVSVYAVNGAAEIVLATITAPNGAFSFGAGPGEWEVYAANRAGQSWQLADPPVVARFANNTEPETATVSILASPTTGTLNGRVLGPGGAPLPPPPSGGSLPLIYVYGQTNLFGRTETVDGSGGFSIPVLPDTYTIEVVIDPASYPDLLAPAPQTATVASGAVAVPVFALEQANAQVGGVVRDASGPLVGVEVEAFADDGRWRSVRTDASGAYSLRLTEGDWALAVYPDNPEGFLQQDDFARVFAQAGRSVTQDFTLSRAAAVVSGSFAVAGEEPAALTDVGGWAYARDEQGNFVAWDQVVQGSFLLSVPPGKLRVGVQLAPDSPYAVSREVELGPTQAGSARAAASGATAALEAVPFERALAAVPAQAGPAPNREITIGLLRRDATITGTLRDAATGEPITGVPVLVSATPDDPGGAYQWAEVDIATGRFSIPVTAGGWSLSYEIARAADTPFAVPVSEAGAVNVAAGATASADIVLARRDGVIEGVLTSGGAPLAGKRVWVSSAIFNDSTLSGPDGRFSIGVPTLGPGGRLASYILGTDLGCATLADCFINVDPRPATVTRPGQGAIQPAQALGNNIDANPAGNNGADLIGLVVGANNQPLSGQSIRNGNRGGIAAAQEVGRATSGGVFSQGGRSYNFTLPVAYAGGGRPPRVSGRIKIAGSFFPVDTAIDAGLLAGDGAPAQSTPLLFVVDPFTGLPVVPPVTFDAREGYTATLQDGTQIEIPPGAVPLGAGDRDQTGRGLVRLTMTPTYNLFPTEQFAEAGRYGFAIAFTAVASNRPIAEPLLAPMLITLRYTSEDIRENSVKLSQLRAARAVGQEWEPADAFVPDRAAGNVIFQTTRSGLWALVQQRTACGECVYLPLARRR